MSLPLTSHAEPVDAKLEDLKPDMAKPAEAALSNDYLNHYSEALMLIEMAAQDTAFLDDLASWQPVSYLAYFQASPLRRAPAAIEAFLALPYEQICAFENLIAIMDRLILAAIASFKKVEGAQSASLTAGMTLPALRCLIDEAGGFLNSGGRNIAETQDMEAAQDVIDRLLKL